MHVRPKVVLFLSILFLAYYIKTSCSYTFHTSSFEQPCLILLPLCMHIVTNSVANSGADQNVFKGGPLCGGWYFRVVESIRHTPKVLHLEN